ncbi:hypothetical protein HDU79_002011, partial [Rhizoclosmatium sp. JEL0117]
MLDQLLQAAAVIETTSPASFTPSPPALSPFSSLPEETPESTPLPPSSMTLPSVSSLMSGEIRTDSSQRSRIREHTTAMANANEAIKPAALVSHM